MLEIFFPTTFSLWLIAQFPRKVLLALFAILLLFLADAFLFVH